VNIVLGVLNSFCGVVLAFAMGPILNAVGAQALEEAKKQGTNAKDAEGVLALLQTVGPIIGVVVLVIGVLFLVAGFGVLKRKGWGRILTLVFATLAGIAAVFSLLQMDFVGAILQGGYCALCYLVLLNNPNALEFRS